MNREAQLESHFRLVQASQLLQLTAEASELRGQLLRYLRKQRDSLPEGNAKTKARRGYLKDLNNYQIHATIVTLIVQEQEQTKSLKLLTPATQRLYEKEEPNAR